MPATAPTCPHDGTRMERDVRDVPLRFEGETRVVKMPGWYCPNCLEGIHTDTDMKASDRALDEMKVAAHIE